MKIKVTSLDTNQLIKVIDYDGLLEICAGDKEMTNSVIRLIRKHPDREKQNERWELLEE